MADFDKIKINGVPYTVKDSATAQAVAQQGQAIAQQGQQITQQGQAIAQQGQQITQQGQLIAAETKAREQADQQIRQEIADEVVTESIGVGEKPGANNIYPTVMYYQTGTNWINDPNTDTNPALRIVKNPQPNEELAVTHEPGGIVVENTISGGTKGTQIAILGQTTYEADVEGNIIGVTGFANSRSATKDDGIITGLWGYPATDYMGPTLCGLEINFKSPTTDVPYNQYQQQGCRMGIFVNNYRDANTGRQRGSFGLVIEGTPVDGDYSSTDYNNWNDWHVGIMLNKIAEVGILFNPTVGQGFKGIVFPTVWGTQENPCVTALSLGDSKINMGSYNGAEFNEGDMWVNGGHLHIRLGGENKQII